MSTIFLTAMGLSRGLLSIVGLIWMIAELVGTWKLFVKMGEPGWKCLIPFYGEYTRYKRIWNTRMYWWSLVAALAFSLISNMFDNGVLSLLFALPAFVINCMAANKLAKSFEQGTGFTIGLILLESVFVVILGFGAYRYIGNTTEQEIWTNGDQY